MNRHNTHFRTALSLLVLLSTLQLANAELSEGQAFPKLEGTDQHEKPIGIETQTRYVIVSFDMAPGKQANKYLESKGADYLPENKAIYIANIHGMPGIIARTFAIPKMQKYPHRILLANEKGLLDELPQEKGKMTVFTLDDSGKIKRIDYWSPKEGADPF